jgi:hypothetical protein
MLINPGIDVMGHLQTFAPSGKTRLVALGTDVCSWTMPSSPRQCCSAPAQGRTWIFPESRTILGAEAAEVAAEVEVLDVRHVNGFVVRLHVTGDFYSPTYVEPWAALLRQYSTLRIFGYTRRHDEGDPIAARIASVAAEFGWSRFAMRLSGAQSDTRSTVVVECPHQKPADAILCGQEIERKKNCGACALCWESEKRIALLQH